MSESPGKHPEMQETRAERDRKAAEKLLSCQACKRKPSTAERPGERIATTFLTNMVRDVSAYQQKARPGSRAWVDNLDGKGSLPAWVMFRSVYPGWWSGIKMEGCKHPLISCKAPTDITVMTTQRSGPKYGLFCSTEYGVFYYLFFVAYSFAQWENLSLMTRSIFPLFSSRLFLSRFFQLSSFPSLHLASLSWGFPPAHQQNTQCFRCPCQAVRQQLTCLKALWRCSSSPLLSPSQALRVIEWWFGDISRKCLCASIPMTTFWSFSVAFLWGIEPHTLFFTCNLLLGTVGTGCMSQLWMPRA